MTRSIILLSIACLVIVSAAQQRTSFLHTQSGVPSNCVRAYAGTNYSGASKDLCSNVSKMSSISFNDKIKSFKLGSNVDFIQIFVHGEYSGAQKKYTSNQSSLPGNYSGKVSSCKIELDGPSSDCARFFDNTGFNGDFKDICSNTSKFGNINFNDKASSVKLGSSVSSVDVWLHANYSGTKKTITSNVSNLGSISMNNNISSAKVDTNGIGANCVRFYNNTGYSGSYYDSCGNTARFGDIGFNDKASSLKLGSNVNSVTVYQHGNYGGTSKNFTGNVSNLANKGMNNKISSCKVHT